MARVRMVMDVSGLRGGTADALGFPWPQHGEFLDCDDVEARSLIEAGIAEAVPAPRTLTEPAAQDETQEPAAPAQARTAPRPKVVK